MQSTYFDHQDTLHKQVYNEFVNGTAITKIRKMFGITKMEINDICTAIFTKEKKLVKQVKHDHPQMENVNVLELDNLICASFTHLTVGDCVVEDGKIVNFKNLYLV
jgi:hypothetical protein